jgi:hypothetical protein
MISILNFIFTIVFYITRWTKQDYICICFKEILNQLNLLYILNIVFTIVFYEIRLTKQDLSYIIFEEFLNQLNLIYFYICLYL